MKRLKTRSTRVDRILPIGVFEREVGEGLGLQNGLAKNDLDALLVYLARDTKQIAFDDQVSPSPAALVISNIDMPFLGRQSAKNQRKHASHFQTRSRCCVSKIPHQ
jgi:hypothetical protein